jgi:vesicle-associated membrane protein 7
LEAVSGIALANIGKDFTCNRLIRVLDKVIQRGEQIELLVDRTENLSATSVQFKKKSTELKNVMWWRNVKIMIGIAVAVLVTIYML